MSLALDLAREKSHALEEARLGGSMVKREKIRPLQTRLHSVIDPLEIAFWHVTEKFIELIRHWRHFYKMAAN